MNRTYAVCVMAICLAVSNAALALPVYDTYVYAEFVDVQPGGPVYVNLGNGPKRLDTGVHVLQVSDELFSVGDEGEGLVTLAAESQFRIDAFCIEPMEPVPTAGMVEYGIIAPETGPQGSDIPPMGLTKARDLSKLFDAHMGAWDTGDARADNLAAAAFQLAVWEIVLEDGANAYNLSQNQGAFYATSGASAVAQANEWLAELDSLAFVDIGLRVLTNQDKQDFAVIIPGFGNPEIPEPLTILAVGLSVAGLGRYARRRAVSA